jgi:leucyl-tRNA synthetase
MSPVIPHLTHEILDKQLKLNEIKWPKVKEEYLKSEEIIIVIQVNGKKRNTISLKKESNENSLIEKIKEMKLIEKYVKDKNIIKTIYVKNKLINFIIK